MKCPNCGEEVYKGLNFCPNCGSKVEAAATNSEEVSENNVQEPTNLENNVQDNTSTSETNTESNLKGAFENNNNQNTDNNNANNNPEDKNAEKKDETTPNLLCALACVLFFGGEIFGFFIPGIGPYLMTISPLIGIILTIYVRVKYPENTFGKILSYLIIIGIIMAIISFFLLILMCKFMLDSISSCPG